MFDDPTQFEPLLIPEGRPLSRELIGAAAELCEASAAFAASVRPPVAAALADLAAGMNCYYSNLIEGHRTLPLEIHEALQHRPGDEDRAKRHKSLATAHIDVGRWARDQIVTAESMTPFIVEIHRRFCERLPDPLLALDDGSRMVPGEIRKREVKVGQHVCPAAASLDRFLARYAAVYGGTLERAGRGGIYKLDAVVAAVLAHHRLAWIHPFLDGNGRVARILLDVMLRQAGLTGIGLWSMSRALAKSDDRYKAALAGADHARMGDLDGRGNLSERKLAEFGHYMLDVALDQVRFMGRLFALEELEQRARAYFERVRVDLKPESGSLYIHALRAGEFERMEAQRITGRPERTSRDILSALVAEELLVSDTPRGKVRAGFPPHALGTLFPNLYPTGDLDTRPPKRAMPQSTMTRLK